MGLIMPGIVGFGYQNLSYTQEKSQILRKMQDLLTHRSFNVKDELFLDSHVYATRIHTNIIQKKPQPYHHENLYVWLDGEFFNQAELRDISTSECNSDLSILAFLFQQNKGTDFSFLKEIDGIYSAVIYDSQKQKIYLISDRYGLCHLYWMIKDNNFVWASEVKAMLTWPTFTPTIDRQSIEDFFKRGHLLGNRTWFEEVKLLPAGTVLTWDIQRRTLHEYCYWSWNEITPMTGEIDEDEVAEELGRLFIDAVRRRCTQEDTGVCLSGGLDSRAILAAMPHRQKPIHTITFGKMGCDDIRIASRVAKAKGARHHIVLLNRKNWLLPRFEGIWLTDGQLNLRDMHIISIYQLARKYFTINLSGLLGDAILGGWYIRKHWNVIEKITNTGRRFTCEGIRLGGSFIINRKPFFDNKLMEFIMSIPESLRKDSYMYNKMLLRKFPEFYESIPWQRTGLPISGRRIPKRVEWYRRIKNKCLRELGHVGLIKYSSPYPYADYTDWIRNEPARTIFDRILNHSNALYPEYISREKVIQEWEKHLDGEDHSSNICLYMTLEIWLQQVFTHKYRPENGHIDL